jgi:hypothetical protein
MTERERAARVRRMRTTAPAAATARALRDRAARHYVLNGRPTSAPPLPAGLYLVATSDRQFARHHRAGARGACRRRPHRMRGHARYPQASRPLWHRHPARSLSRAQCRRGTTEAHRPACRRRRDRAGLGRRDAVRVRPRLQARTRSARGGRERDGIAGSLGGARGAHVERAPHRPVLVRGILAIRRSSVFR